jgi:hypothetical protein
MMMARRRMVPLVCSIISGGNGGIAGIPLDATSLNRMTDLSLKG